MAIHSKAQVEDIAKLAYLKDALKDGPARHAIESLTIDAKCYKEAIDCLQNCYDQPRVMHRAHTCAILDAHSLKDGNSKELRCLHDVTKQHLRALRVMKYETFASLVTSILELKVDHITIFKWQRHTHSSNTVPDFGDLLEFLDLRARAGKNAAREGETRRQVSLPEKKAVTKPSYTASGEEYFVGCKTAKHPLYGFRVFYGLPHTQK